MTTPLVKEILSDPASSYWLRKALDEALKRDPVDALNDAEQLLKALSERCESLLRSGPHQTKENHETRPTQ